MYLQNYTIIQLNNYLEKYHIFNKIYVTKK